MAATVSQRRNAARNHCKAGAVHFITRPQLMMHIDLPTFKAITAAKAWRRLQRENQLPEIIQGITFRDGIEVSVPTSHSAA